MGTSNLTERSNTIFDASWWNQIRASLLGALVPRNGSGVPEASAGDLGTPALPWAAIYADEATIGGVLLDADVFAGRSHRIQSGAAKTSGYPEFLSAVGTGNGLTANLLATATPLALVVNSTSVTIGANTPFASLTAAPASQNTCLINVAAWAGEATSKILGEHGGYYITIDNIGTGITALNGTIAAFKTGTEVFLARVDTTNSRIYPIYRGWAGTSRAALSNNDTITLLKVSTLLINVDGLTKVASTYYPESVGVAPAAGTAGKIYMERDSGKVAYDDGATISYDYMILGWAVCDSADCVYVQPYDFDLQWQGTFKLDFDPLPTATTQRVKAGSVVSVKGVDREFIGWDDMSTADVDSGETWAILTPFYIYIKHDGSMVMSSVAPRPYSETLRGHYHPQNYYRCIGVTASTTSDFLLPAIPMEWSGTYDVLLAAVASSTSYILPPAPILVGRRLRYSLNGNNTGTAAISLIRTDGISAVGEWGSDYGGLFSRRDFFEVFSADGINYEIGDFCASNVHATTLTLFNATVPSVSLKLMRRAGGRNYKGQLVVQVPLITPTSTKNGTGNPALAAAIPSFFRPASTVVGTCYAVGLVAELTTVTFNTDGTMEWDIYDNPWQAGGSYSAITDATLVQVG